MSGSVEVIFCSRGIFCNLIVPNLERIRCRYRLLEGFSLSVPSREGHNCQANFVTLYKDALVGGLRLPLYVLAQDLLIYLGIAPDDWRFLMEAIHLWP